MFVELFLPAWALDDRRRWEVAQRLVRELIPEGLAPAEVTASGRDLCHVVVHEMDTWVAGTRAVVAGELPPYVARVTLPESWRVKMSGHVVAQVTKVLAEAQDDPRRAYDEPAVWVYLVGVPDGSYGAMGKALTSTDLVQIITKSQGEAKAHGVPAPEPEPGTLIDPVCGMTVPLTEGALTLEVDGTTYAFCTKACREVFAEDHKVARP